MTLAIDTADQYIAAVVERAEDLATATVHEMEMQLAKPLQKDAAIKRVMAAHNLATTPAEKICEGDSEYAAFLSGMTASVRETILARGQMDAARLRAQLAVNLTRGE